MTEQKMSKFAPEKTINRRKFLEYLSLFTISLTRAVIPKSVNAQEKVPRIHIVRDAINVPKLGFHFGPPYSTPERLNILEQNGVETGGQSLIQIGYFKNLINQNGSVNQQVITQIKNFIVETNELGLVPKINLEFFEFEDKSLASANLKQIYEKCYDKVLEKVVQEIQNLNINVILTFLHECNTTAYPYGLGRQGGEVGDNGTYALKQAYPNLDVKKLPKEKLKQKKLEATATVLKQTLERLYSIVRKGDPKNLIVLDFWLDTDHKIGAKYSYLSDFEKYANLIFPTSYLPDLISFSAYSRSGVVRENNLKPYSQTRLSSLMKAPLEWFNKINAKYPNISLGIGERGIQSQLISQNPSTNNEPSSVNYIPRSEVLKDDLNFIANTNIIKYIIYFLESFEKKAQWDMFGYRVKFTEMAVSNANFDYYRDIDQLPIQADFSFKTKDLPSFVISELGRLKCYVVEGYNKIITYEPGQVTFISSNNQSDITTISVSGFRYGEITSVQPNESKKYYLYFERIDTPEFQKEMFTLNQIKSAM
jgi:hypothetical protein